MNIFLASGTGTPVGDPKEANTLGEFFAANNVEDDECRTAVLIGSVKTNIGHLESAAGVAGVIKVLLMMKHGKIVPSLHVQSPNPKIDLENYNLEIAQHLTDWPYLPGGRTRLSCVNSFGFGGTNSHAIIKQENIDMPLCLETNKSNMVKHVITVSGKDKLSLKRNLLHLMLKVGSAKYYIEDISYTSTCRRDHYPYRIAFQTSSCSEIPKLCDDQIKQLDIKKFTTMKKPNVVFVFCGVGTTWLGMCKDLIRTEMVFRETVKRIDIFLTPLAGLSMLEKLMDGFDINDPLIAHLAIFTCQVALTELWSHFGVKPDVVVGQSVGEVAGAYAAGVLSLQEAVEVIYVRSQLLSKANGGAMLVVGNCDMAVVEDICQKFNGKVSVAVRISPFACTLSGESDAIDQLMQENVLNTEKILLRKLKVPCAYHSHRVEDASELLEKRLNGFNPNNQTKCTLISTVTGTHAISDDFTTPKYWRRNVREQVLFGQAIKEAIVKGNANICIEIGPKPVLKFHLSNIIDKQNAVVVASMLGNRECDSIKLAVMELYKGGVDIVWKNVVSAAKLTDIPSCQLNPTEPLLFQSNITLLNYAGVNSPHFNHLFVERVGSKEMRFLINMSPSSTWFLYEHVVSGTIMVPGAMYLEVAQEIGKHVFKTGEMATNISAKYLHPLTLNKGERSTADVIVKKCDDDWTWSVIVYKNKLKVAKCQIQLEKPIRRDRVDITAIRRRCVSKQCPSETYTALTKLGFTYGKDLKILGNAMTNDTECIVEMELSEAVMQDTSCTHLHPAILDGLLQTPVVLNMGIESDVTLLPGGMGSFHLRQQPERKMLAYTLLIGQSKNDFRYNALLLTTNGDVVAEVKDYVIKCIGTTEPNLDNHILYQVQWEEIDSFPKPPQMKPDDNNQHKSLLISSSESKANVIHSELKQTEIIHVETKDENLELKVTAKLEMKGLSSVILIADGEDCSQMTGEQVMQEVLDNSKALLSICKILENQNNTHIPVLIITEKVQSVSNSNSTVKNVIGSELWGIARSVVRESPLNLTLIDIHTSLRSSCPVLRDILIFKSPFVSNECELLITDNSLYCNRIVKLQEKLNPYRWNSLAAGDPVRIKSTQPDSTNDTFYTLQNNAELESGVILHIDTAVLHDENFSPLTLQLADNDVPVWQDDKEDGYDILTYEVSGTVTETTKNIANESTTSSRWEGKYVACSSLTVQRETTIPKGSLLRVDDQPNYFPGLLTRVALLLQMKEQLLEGNTFLLAEPDDIAVVIVQSILSEENQAAHATIDDLIASPTAGIEATNLIVLESTDVFKLGMALCKFKDLQLVVATNVNLTRVSMKSVQNTNPSVCFKVLSTEEMLSPYALGKHVPQAVKWLRKNMSRMTFSSFKKPTVQIMRLPSQNHSEANVKVTQNQLFRKNRCYIVVGGLTGLGWEIVQCIAAEGAGMIVALARKHPNADKRRDIDVLQVKHRVQIKTFSVDITNIKSLQGTFDKIDETFGNEAVKGIFHGGAVLEDALFINLTEEQLRRVLLPKVLGSWNLHEISKRYALDYFILHSSISSIFGNTAQSNYGAGNAFMDSLAHFRVGQGLTGLGINWGPLPLGLLDHMAVREELQRHGFNCLKEQYIHEYLLKSLMMDKTQITIGSFQWKLIDQHFVDSIPMRSRRRFINVIGDSPGENLPNSKYLMPTLDHDLCTREGITACVKDIAAKVLQVDVDVLESSSNLASVGFDSMQAIAFAKSIRDFTTYRIPIVRLLSDSTTISDIVEYLHSRLQTVKVIGGIENVDDITEENI
ncbi:Erythronolide synthase, modules 3 and 4 [Mizuhopecten yessoensis]|uniref:Erythronolide synthase, modules 3 and 4 n=1 Tax=Mizuhopecten yessoensis TaxID=6573 RepID=A0A210R1B5_MIZYE|nr:Erythronolide synthase, modules 3 and 4 [Mizuhopecten yessoensis]